MRENFNNDLVVVAPDAGPGEGGRALQPAPRGGVGPGLQDRPPGSVNEVKARHIVGDVEGRHCVLIDDMIDTAGTICAAADLLSDAGAAQISVMATHAMFSDPAVDRLKAADLKGRSSPTPCRWPTTATSTNSRSFPSPRSSPTPSTPCSRTPRSRSSSAGTTWSRRSEPAIGAGRSAVRSGDWRPRGRRLRWLAVRRGHRARRLPFCFNVEEICHGRSHAVR